MLHLWNSYYTFAANEKISVYLMFNTNLILITMRTLDVALAARVLRKVTDLRGGIMCQACTKHPLVVGGFCKIDVISPIQTNSFKMKDGDMALLACPKCGHTEHVHLGTIGL